MEALNEVGHKTSIVGQMTAADIIISLLPFV